MGTGVNCTTMHPGFVTSEIARIDNDGVWHPERTDPRPSNLIWPTDKAAKVMVKAISCFDAVNHFVKSETRCVNREIIEIRDVLFFQQCIILSVEIHFENQSF